MRSPIPKEIRDLLADDPFMTHCVVGHECEGRVEWNHALIYGGKRQNERYAIIPVCNKHHRAMSKSTKAICDMAMRTRIKYFKAEEEFSRKFPRSDLLTNKSTV